MATMNHPPNLWKITIMHISLWKSAVEAVTTVEEYTMEEQPHACSGKVQGKH